MLGSVSMMANGDILPCRFVKQDTTADGRIVAATADTDTIIGVSQEGTRLFPWSALDDGKAAIAGESLNVYTWPQKAVYIQLGGTVAINDRLTATTAGKAVTTATDKKAYFAIARSAGILDQVIKCDLVGPLTLSI